jgi:hypothetical protein
MATVLAFQRAAAAAAAVAAARAAPTVPTAALPPLVVEDEDEGAVVVAVAAEAEVAVEEVPIASSAARLGIGQATAQRVTRSRVVVDGAEADTVVPAVAEAPAAAVVAEAAVAVAATSASSAASRGIGPATVPMASAGRLGLKRGYSGESIMSVLVPTVLHSEHVPGDYFSICARRMRRALPLSGTRAIFPPRGQWPCTHLFF